MYVYIHTVCKSESYKSSSQGGVSPLYDPISLPPSKSIFQVPSGRGSCGCKALYDMVPGPERLMKLSR